MLHIWDAIEADFLRDYRIVLMEQLDQITWRYFLVLLNNLSPYGAVASQLRNINESSNAENTTDDEDEKAANQFFSSITAM